MEKIGVVDKVIVIVRDKSGRIKEKRAKEWSNNGVTDNGLVFIMDRIVGANPTVPAQTIAIGTGTAPFSTSQTGLQNEVKRKTGVASMAQDPLHNLQSAKVSAEFSSQDGLTGVVDVAEAGLFGQVSAQDVMVARVTFQPVAVNFQGGDTIAIEFYIAITR